MTDTNKVVLTVTERQRQMLQTLVDREISGTTAAEYGGTVYTSADLLGLAGALRSYVVSAATDEPLEAEARKVVDPVGLREHLLKLEAEARDDGKRT